MQDIFQSEYVIFIYLYNNHSFINRLVSTQRSYITTQVQEDNKPEIILRRGWRWRFREEGCIKTLLLQKENLLAPRKRKRGEEEESEKEEEEDEEDSDDKEKE